jgi:hypothetical protein
MLAFIFCAISAVWADQTPLATTIESEPRALRGAIFDSVLRSRILEITKQQNITGYSIGVLRLPKSGSASASSSNEAEVEFAQWGQRNEAGDPVSQDVCRFFLDISFRILIVSGYRLSSVLPRYRKPSLLLRLVWSYTTLPTVVMSHHYPTTSPKSPGIPS